MAAETGWGWGASLDQGLCFLCPGCRWGKHSWHSFGEVVMCQKKPSSARAAPPQPHFSLHLLHWQADSLLLSHQGSPFCYQSLTFTNYPSVQFSHSVVSNSLRPHGLQHARPPCPSPTPGVHPNSCPFGDAIRPSHPLSSLLLLPSIFPSIRVFSNESVLLIRWPKYWSFSFSISPSKEYSGLISFKMDWLDLLAVQGILKGLLQHHRSKASTFWHSVFLIVQLSHPYTTTGKTIAFLLTPQLRVTTL